MEIVEENEKKEEKPSPKSIINSFFQASTCLDSLENNLENDITEENIVYSSNQVLEPIILKKKKLIEMVKNLNKLEAIGIFQIIKEEKIQYSENTNGVFINLKYVSEQIIDKIFYYLEFIFQKNKELDIGEEILDNARKNIVEKQVKESVFPQVVQHKVIKESYLSDDEREVINYDDYLNLSSDEEDEDNDAKNQAKKKKKTTVKKNKVLKPIKDVKKKNNDDGESD